MRKTGHRDAKSRLKVSALIGVLGVVYGDIGTSPLYALQASLGYFQKSGLKYADIFGILSLIFWSLIIVVTLKYVTFIMRADNNGEGGTLSLMALASRVARSDRTKGALGIIGIVGAGLFFGDGVITPAISILSAVEGITVISPDLSRLVLPIALVVIAVLFLVQRKGTDAVGRAFGPIMVVWFLSLGLLGLSEIVRYPFVLEALNPYYSLAFMVRHDRIAFIALGRRGAGGYRRRGVVRRYEPFRPPPDPRQLDIFRAPLPGTELFRSGRRWSSPIPPRSTTHSTSWRRMFCKSP